MFTGLIQHLGRVATIQPNPGGSRIAIDAGDWQHAVSPGESIAVNGCCLTALPQDAPATSLAFDVVHQTLRMTTIGSLEVGELVNLEHAATPTTLLGGHIVQGHVDGVAHAVRHFDPASDNEWRIRVTPPESLMKFIPPRASITIDGVSLTVASLGPDWFEIALIPTTLEATNLSRIGKAPVPVNIEADCLVKAAIHALERVALI